MTRKILQLNVMYSISRAELEAAWLEAAQPVTEVTGPRWNGWLVNEAEHEAGGIYLFESEAAAQSYVDGTIAGALKSSPVIRNFSAKLFDVMESHTAITRGRVKTATNVTV